MALKIYNTLHRKKETFKPRKGKNVNFFVCGITSYDYAHIGHARVAIFFDVVAKYLRYSGYKVKYIQNITDIDDKVIQRGEELKKEPLKLASKFADIYLAEMKQLRVDSVDAYPRATRHIKEMIKQIQTLEKRGYAYKTEDGVYFDITKFKDYGKLSKVDVSKLKAGARVCISEHKKHPGDFALWKKMKPREPYWKSPWFDGRPGWHIEDTAMTEHYFGPQYDLHGGGEDLIFPHHESEIAQQEAASGKKPFVKYWMHIAFLKINHEKMSKSLKNFVTIQEVLKKWDVDTIRFFYLSTHYKKPLDYTEDSFKEANSAVSKLQNTLSDIDFRIKTAKEKSSLKFGKYKKDFISAMDDDFNTPRAIAVLFELATYVNKNIDKAGKSDLKKAKELFREFGDVLGLLQEKKQEKIPAEITNLIQQREKARKDKDWKTADKVRDQLAKKGYIVQDTPHGSKIIRNA
jgi:cysteinyl-tRNA synthetase